MEVVSVFHPSKLNGKIAIIEMTPIFCLSKFSQTSALKEYRTFVFRNCIEKFRQKVRENSLIILSKVSHILFFCKNELLQKMKLK